MPIIEFKNFTFKYNNLKEPTLKNINLRIWIAVYAVDSQKSTRVECVL